VSVGQETFELSNALLDVFGPWMLNPESKTHFQQGKKRLPFVDVDVFRWVISCAQGRATAVGVAVPLPRELIGREELVKA
jgi:hypothetical protein